MSTRIINGDCLIELLSIADCSIDSCVTDPPYHLTTGKKGGTGPASVNLESPYGRARVTTGFMGMKWDGGDIAHNPALWAEVLRVLKPGGFCLSFAGTRTYHRMACAIEDAGFEIRDMIGWLYGSGFPKGTDKAKIPAAWKGWNTALKPALEPLCFARKPMDGTLAQNLEKWGTGAIWIDGCRIEISDVDSGDVGREITRNVRPEDGWGMNGELAQSGVCVVKPEGRWPANVLLDGSEEVLACFPDSKGAQGDVKGTEPSHTGDENTTCYGEFARVPQAKRGDTGSAARFFYSAKASKADRNEGLYGQETVIIQWSETTERPKWDCADRKVKLQVDVATSPPRVISVSGTQNKTATEWSMMLFGSEPTALCRMGTTFTTRTTLNHTTGLTTLSYFQNLLTNAFIQDANSGMANGGSLVESAEPGTFLLRTTNARMASALGVAPAALPMLLKISASERRSEHPTVKPTNLMRYLCRLVTPRGGTVLDPFTGSGSTGRGAIREGFGFIGIEIDAEYCEIARARINADAPLFADAP